MKPQNLTGWLVLVLLLTFAALGMWAAKVQLDYLPRPPSFAINPR